MKQLVIASHDELIAVGIDRDISGSIVEQLQEYPRIINQWVQINAGPNPDLAEVFDNMPDELYDVPKSYLQNPQ